MATKKCPNCGSANPPSALRCSCGYDFEKGQVSKVRVDLDVQVGTEEKPKPKKRRTAIGDLLKRGTARKALLICFGLLLIIFGALLPIGAVFTLIDEAETGYSTTFLSLGVLGSFFIISGWYIFHKGIVTPAEKLMRVKRIASAAKVCWILGLCLIGSPFLLALLDSAFLYLLIFALPLGAFFLFFAPILSIAATVRWLRRIEMNEITYKGFSIIARPARSHDGNWNTDIWIETYGEKPKGQNFTSLDTFPTEKEAVEFCLQYGKDIIDGKVEGSTVEDL